MGLTYLLSSSDVSSVNKVNNPRFLKYAQNNLRRKQKQLFCKMKLSNKRKKSRLILSKAHERLANARNDFQHKVSRTIIDKKQAVIVEDLS